MLSENIESVGRYRETFSEQVSDSFGQSICESAFDAAERCLSVMLAAEEEAKTKQAAVNALLVQIRLMI